MTPEEIQYQITQLHFDNQSAYSTRAMDRDWETRFII